jgi:RNA-directed DNA polymerase
MSRRERRIEPTGARPVQASAGAPGSRPQPECVNPQATAGRQEPLQREQECGPQHQVNPAASTKLQGRSRAAHITAKAMSAAGVTGAASAAGSSGVWGAARVQGTMRDAGDPTAQPLSRQGRAYKPKVKACGVQRESEGAKVPKMEVQDNASVGKGPCFSQASEGGKREGMAQIAGSKYPDGIKPIDKVRRLQRKLYVAAKQQPGRRFHALYDRIYRSDVLWEAWGRVRCNRGAAGVDKVTLAAVEEYGVERMLTELCQDLQTGKYRPQPVLRRYIPKDGGKKQRPLGIPTVKDRVAQAAAKLVLEPIFEADFKGCSFGFRPRRSATQALEAIRELANRGYNHVLDADIRDYFGSIDHELLMSRVRRRITDQRVLKLLRGWLRAGVMEDGKYAETIAGTPQGGVISPLLSNIYLHFLDAVWERQCAGIGALVRYADDFVVMCPSAKAIEGTERRVNIILNRLRLNLNPEKTRRVDLSYGKEGFNFLGCYLRKRMSGRLKEQGKQYYFLQRWPSARSMKRVRQKVKELTGSERNGVKDVRVLIKDLNPVLQGWGNYFRTGNAAIKFNSVDRYVWRRLNHFLIRRAGRNLKPGQVPQWTPVWFQGHGLYRLDGTIRYPGVAQATQ